MIKDLNTGMKRYVIHHVNDVNFIDLLRCFYHTSYIKLIMIFMPKSLLSTILDHLLITLLMGSKPISVLAIQSVLYRE